MSVIVFFAILTILLALPVGWPGIDLVVSGAFYRAKDGFWLAEHPAFVFLHDLAVDGSRVLAAVFALGFLASWLLRRKKAACALLLDPKAWLFLLLALAVGPGLIANVGFKDHWGRARPREIVAFGGDRAFSPALIPQPDPQPNESFVCGDGAFGFFLPAFGFVAPPRLSRRFFWGGVGGGVLFGVDRLAMGAHFFSDVVYAAFFMLAAMTALFALMYGRAATVARGRGFFIPASRS